MVNFDSFFLIANEKQFFMKTVRFMGFNTIPMLNHYEEFDPDDRYSEKEQVVYNLWKSE